MAGSLASLVGFSSTMRAFDQLLDQVGGEVVYVVGTNVKYGVFLELGTSKMQAYPWARPAVEEFKNDPEGFIDKHTDTNIDGIGSSEALVSTVALALERRMKQNASAGRESNRSPGTHPDHPQRQTPNLVPSIRAEKVT